MHLWRVRRTDISILSSDLWDGCTCTPYPCAIASFGLATGLRQVRIPLGLPDGRDYAIANSAVRDVLQHSQIWCSSLSVCYLINCLT